MLFNNYMFAQNVVLKAGGIFIGTTVVLAVVSSIINYLSGENEKHRHSRITMEEIKANEYYEDANTDDEEIVVAQEVDTDADDDAAGADAAAGANAAGAAGQVANADADADAAGADADDA